MRRVRPTAATSTPRLEGFFIHCREGDQLPNTETHCCVCEALKPNRACRKLLETPALSRFDPGDSNLFVYCISRRGVYSCSWLN